MGDHQATWQLSLLGLKAHVSPSVTESGSEKTSGPAKCLMSYGTRNRAHPHFETQFLYLSSGRNPRTNSALASPDAMIGVVSAVLSDHPAALLQGSEGQSHKLISFPAYTFILKNR